MRLFEIILKHCVEDQEKANLSAACCHNCSDPDMITVKENQNNKFALRQFPGKKGANSLI